MTNKPTEAMIEKVARGIYAASGYEAERLAGPDCLVPGYDEDDEDAREFCRTLATAAIEAMRSSAPQEPDDGPVVTDEEVERLLCRLNWEFQGDLNTSEGAIAYAIRAVEMALYKERTRFRAPDDDAEWLRNVVTRRFRAQDNKDRLERIATRLQGEE